MANFPNVRDDRWRPDLESSQRRVREEEHDEREPKVVYSRELSFVPGRRKQFEAHDAQTRALIRQLEQLERLPCGGEVNALLEDWHWLDSMGTPEAKQQFLEPKIAAVRQDPHANKHLLIFLALVFEPVRRSVSKAFVDVQGGLRPQPRDLSWGNREEARRIQEIDRQSLFDVTREAALEAIFRYPTPAPPKFFPWLRETIAHRALDHLKADLAELPTCAATRAEAEAMQLALAGFERLDGPPLRDGKGLRAWRDQFRMRDVFDVVEEFFRHDPVRRACQEAVGRLPRAQREIIDGYFFHELDVPTLASARGVSESTVYNQKRSLSNAWRTTTSSSLPCTRSAWCATALASSGSRPRIQTAAYRMADAWWSSRPRLNSARGPRRGRTFRIDHQRRGWRDRRVARAARPVSFALPAAPIGRTP